MRSSGIIFLVFVLMLSTGNLTKAQKAKYQGDIIIKMSQYVTWPANKDQHIFVIGVIGNTADFNSFQQLAVEKNKLEGKLIEVRYFECADDIDACQLLYISEECKSEMSRIVKKTRDEPILIVSAKPGYGTMGSIINFVDTDGKLKFELNQAQASKRSLIVSEQLKALAIVI